MMLMLILLASLFVLTVIREGGDGKFHVYSEKGKHLGGPYDTKEEAQKRLSQVEYFKAAKAKGTKPPMKEGK